MASYVTQSRPDKQYQSQIPTETIDFALQSRQKRYDHEYAKLENFYANLSSIDLAKVEDQEYFANNLKAVKQKVDAMGGTGDLSVTGAGEVMAYIGQAADDVVVNGYVSTKKYRAKQAEWEELKKKNIELYNDANYQYSMLNTSKWLTDGQIGSSIDDYSNRYTGRGVGEVNPYIDVLGEANKIIKDIEPESYVTFNKAGQFQYFSKKGERLTDERITQAMETMLLGNPQIQKQLEINSWAQFGNLSDEDFVQGYSAIGQQQTTDINSTIKSLNSELALTGDANKKQEIQSTIDFLTQKKKIYSNTTPQQILNNRVNIERRLYTDNFIKNIADTFKYEKVKDMGFELDREGFERWKEGNVQSRHDEDIALKQQEIGLKRREALYNLRKDWVKFTSEGETGQARVVAEQLADYYTSSGITKNGQPLSPDDAEMMVFSDLNRETKGTIGLEKELTNIELSMLALNEKDQSVVEANNAIQGFVESYFDVDKLKNLGLITPQGEVTTRFKNQLARSENDLYKGTPVDALLNGVNMSTVSREFKNVMALEDLAKQHNKIYDDVLTKKQGEKFLEIQETLNSAPNTIRRNPLNVFGRGRDEDLTTNKTIRIEEQGNILPTTFQIVENKNGETAVYKLEDQRGVSVAKETYSFPTIDEAVSFLTLTSQKDITEDYAEAYKNLYGGEIQGTERVFTGQADVGYFRDAVDLAQNIPDAEKEKYRSIITKDYKIKDDEVSPRFRVTTIPQEGRSYLVINDNRYLLNTDKDPKSILTRDVNATLFTANEKKKQNLQKNADREKYFSGAGSFYKPTEVVSLPKTNLDLLITPRVIKKQGTPTPDIQYQLQVSAKDNNSNKVLSTVIATDEYGRNLLFEDIASLEKYKSNILNNGIIVNRLFKDITNE